MKTTAKLLAATAIAAVAALTTVPSSADEWLDSDGNVSEPSGAELAMNAVVDSTVERAAEAINVSFKHYKTTFAPVNNEYLNSLSRADLIRYAAYMTTAAARHADYYNSVSVACIATPGCNGKIKWWFSASSD